MHSTRELAQAYFNAFNSSDVEAMMALLHEDIAHDINQGSREIGAQAFRLHYANAMKCFDETRTDIDIMQSSNANRVAVEFTRRGTYTRTISGYPEAKGQTYSLASVIIFESDDGLLTRISGYFNKQALIDQLT